MFFISPAGGWAGLDDEGFLKDLAFGRPSAGPAGRPTRPDSRRHVLLFAGPAGPKASCLLFGTHSPEKQDVLIFGAPRPAPA